MICVIQYKIRSINTHPILKLIINFFKGLMTILKRFQTLLKFLVYVTIKSGAIFVVICLKDFQGVICLVVGQWIEVLVHHLNCEVKIHVFIKINHTQIF